MSEVFADVRSRLSEFEWDRVYEIRVRSKLGTPPSEAEAKLLQRAYEEDKDRYASFNKRIFDETNPARGLTGDI